MESIKRDKGASCWYFSRICIACNDKLQSRSLNQFEKYLYNDTSETEVNINLSVKKVEKISEKIVTSGKLIIAVYASYVYVDISCTCSSRRLEYNSRFVSLGCWSPFLQQCKVPYEAPSFSKIPTNKHLSRWPKTYCF